MGRREVEKKGRGFVVRPWTAARGGWNHIGGGRKRVRGTCQDRAPW